MASAYPDDVEQWHFQDIHAFKDFVSSVIVCAPDQFPERDWLKPEEQMNLDRAFNGLRYGLELATKEQGELALLSRCRILVEEAHAEYKAGRDQAGQLKLEEMEKLLLMLPTE